MCGVALAYMLTVPSNQPTVLPSLFRTGPTQTAAYKIQKVPQFQTVKIFLQGRIVRPIPFTLWAAQRMTFIRWIIRVYLKRSKISSVSTNAKSCLCLRNIRHFLCFQIHLRKTLSTPTYSIKRKTPFFDTLYTFICTYFCFYYIIVPAKMKHLTPDEQTYLRFVWFSLRTWQPHIPRAILNPKR